MLVQQLIPNPEDRVSFSYPSLYLAPDQSGCYALTAFDEEVLYIGQSENIRSRMEQHLGDGSKQEQTPSGKVFWLYYGLCPIRDLDNLENGWINEHILREGRMPFFNKIHPPS